MKCEKCGSEISINNKYCPNCGALNEIGASHVDDMERFENRFNKTESDVRSKSNWFVRYITPMVVLVASIIIFSILSALAFDSGYTVGKKRIASYNSSNEEQIEEHLQEMLDNGEYLGTYMLYDIADQTLPDDSGSTYYNGWYRYYSLVDDLYKVEEGILAHLTSGDNTYGDSNISKAANGIYDFYRTSSSQSLSNATSESLPYIDKLRTELERFLRAYCDFTDEDITDLPNKDTTGVISLIARRMLNDD